MSKLYLVTDPTLYSKVRVSKKRKKYYVYAEDQDNLRVELNSFADEDSAFDYAEEVSDIYNWGIVTDEF